MSPAVTAAAEQRTQKQPAPMKKPNRRRKKRIPWLKRKPARSVPRVPQAVVNSIEGSGSESADIAQEVPRAPVRNLRRLSEAAKAAEPDAAREEPPARRLRTKEPAQTPTTSAEAPRAATETAATHLRSIPGHKGMVLPPKKSRRGVRLIGMEIPEQNEAAPVVEQLGRTTSDLGTQEAAQAATMSPVPAQQQLVGATTRRRSSRVESQPQLRPRRTRSVEVSKEESAPPVLAPEDAPPPTVRAVKSPVAEEAPRPPVLEAFENSNSNGPSTRRGTKRLKRMLRRGRPPKKQYIPVESPKAEDAVNSENNGLPSIVDDSAEDTHIPVTTEEDEHVCSPKEAPSKPSSPSDLPVKEQDAEPSAVITTAETNSEDNQEKDDAVEQPSENDASGESDIVSCSGKPEETACKEEAAVAEETKHDDSRAAADEKSSPEARSAGSPVQLICEEQEEPTAVENVQHTPAVAIASLPEVQPEEQNDRELSAPKEQQEAVIETCSFQQSPKESGSHQDVPSVPDCVENDLVDSLEPRPPVTLLPSDAITNNASVVSTSSQESQDIVVDNPSPQVQMPPTPITPQTPGSNPASQQTCLSNQSSCGVDEGTHAGSYDSMLGHSPASMMGCSPHDLSMDASSLKATPPVEPHRYQEPREVTRGPRGDPMETARMEMMRPGRLAAPSKPDLSCLGVYTPDSSSSSVMSSGGYTPMDMEQLREAGQLREVNQLRDMNALREPNQLREVSQLRDVNHLREANQLRDINQLRDLREMGQRRLDSPASSLVAGEPQGPLEHLGSPFPDCTHTRPPQAHHRQQPQPHRQTPQQSYCRPVTSAPLSQGAFVAAQAAVAQAQAQASAGVPSMMQGMVLMPPASNYMSISGPGGGGPSYVMGVPVGSMMAASGPPQRGFSHGYAYGPASNASCSLAKLQQLTNGIMDIAPGSPGQSAAAAAAAAAACAMTPPAAPAASRALSHGQPYGSPTAAPPAGSTKYAPRYQRAPLLSSYQGALNGYRQGTPAGPYLQQPAPMQMVQPQYQEPSQNPMYTYSYLSGSLPPQTLNSMMRR
ncbi:hypothetical protein HPB49_008799 [Dermacentor silvarum]|uniref:Uncharacterized protein n=1 Tax=Dermacentor silvarum TaxID=543639 RepID=A0ACB8DY01_DERSI|nr:hypothetical protein HPB49_008799 [Dermacentor silvarum]